MKIKKESKEELVKIVLEHYTKGYNVTEILNIIKDRHPDEEALFRLINTAITKFRGSLTEEQKAIIAKNREIHSMNLKSDKEEKNKELATLVKERAEKDVLHTLNSTKIQQAIKVIAILKGVSEDVLRDYLKKYYSDFYIEYTTDANLTEEHFIGLANKIVEKSISRPSAEKMIGYSKMMSWLEENDPVLLEKVNETFAFQGKNGPRNFEITNPNRVNFNNLDILIEIMLEFRMPLSDMCEFIDENHEIFLHNAIHVWEDDLIKLSKNSNTSSSLEWYLAEMNLDNIDNLSPEFIARKKARFNEFKEKFDVLKPNIERLNKLVRSETTVPMLSVMQKVEEHVYKGKYHFTNDDVRNLLKTIYKYGLTELDVNHYYGIPRISKSAIVRNFEPQNIDDMIILEGYLKMASFNADYFYSRLQGRS